MEGKLIHLELKYCERCGGLLLRRCGAGTVYCRACSEQLREFPQRHASTRRPAAAVRPVEGTLEGGLQ